MIVDKWVGIDKNDIKKPLVVNIIGHIECAKPENKQRGCAELFKRQSQGLSDNVC